MSELNNNDELLNKNQMSQAANVAGDENAAVDSNEQQQETEPATTSEQKSAKFLDKLSADRQKRLEYLIKQTQIFTHFMTNDTKDDSKKQKQMPKRKAETLATGVAKKSKMDNGASSSIIDTFTSNPHYIKNGKMRNYQLDGLNWLIALAENGVNGILADEMGLGKTLQTISLLGYMKHYKNQNGPFLIIVPLSTLNNWVNECKHWCPSLKILSFYGKLQERRKHLRAELSNGNWDVCITTYEICATDIFQLSRIKWYYIIIDEGHRIKNEKTTLAQCCRRLESINRLILTGTPLQNNLHELWALLNYLLPDVFDSHEDFDEWFNMSNCLNNSEIVDRLHAVLKPFLLRRLKLDVETSLLPKKEVKIYVGLSQMQTELYKSILLKDVASLNLMNRMSVNNIHMQLRKCTNHPYMFEGKEPGPPYTMGKHIIDNSGKLSVLDKLLVKLKEQGSRVLIFVQFLRMIDILEDYLIWRKYKYHVLKGEHSREERNENINEFNSDGSETFIFLLSTRAGGLGINLATADVVIFYDSDWNPQVDLQAMDRAHRIGQKKQVRVFRLITEGTIDEILDDCAERKLHLEKNVIQNGFTNVGPMTENLLSILRNNTNQIFSSKNVELTNDDIDTILSRGEAKTAEKKTKFTEFAKQPEDKRKEAKFYEFDGAMYGKTKQIYDFNFLPRNGHERSMRPDGFMDWTRANYEQFIAANIKYGRFALEKIVHEVSGQAPFDVICYSGTFWNRCNEIADIEKILPKIKGAYDDHLPKGLENQKLKQKKLLENKYKQYKNPYDEMVIIYDDNGDDNNDIDEDKENSNNNNNNISENNKFTKEEDRFLICKLHEFGLDQDDDDDDDNIEVFKKIQTSIRLSSLPKNAYARVCTVQELQKRSETLISFLKLEAENIEKKLLIKHNLRPRKVAFQYKFK